MSRGKLTEQQMRRTLNPVRDDRIETKQGLTYVPQQEIRAELTRTFGVGNWDSQVHDVTLIYETSYPGTGTKSDKTYWTVCYRVGVTLNIRDYEGNPVATFTEYHAEENAPQPNRGEAHALALTSAGSYALRRAAIGIGDNMGLHLYNKGGLDPIVRGTLALTDPDSPLYATVQTRKKEQAERARTTRDEAAVAATSEAAFAEQPPERAASAANLLAAGFAHPDGRKA